MKVSHSYHSLITSITRQKLINIFFYSPENIFYVRELVRLTREEINSVRRELANLESSSILLKEIRGNRLYYWANSSSYLYYNLQILANKHVGLGAKFQENHLKLGKLKALFYSQEFLLHRLQNHGNIDLLIIGEVSLKLTEELVKTEEKVIGREINYMVMDISELNLRLSKRDPIMVDFLLKYPCQIIGNPIEVFK
jgi:hypothetical protein